MNTFRLIILFSIIFLIAFLLETTVINFPFVFLVAVSLAVFIKKPYVFVSAFIVGFAIDAIRVSNFGLTPVFILASVAVNLLYEKYFGSDDILIRTFIVAVAFFLYTNFLSYSIFLSLCILGFGVVTWYLVSILQAKGKFL